MECKPRNVTVSKGVEDDSFALRRIAGMSRLRRKVHAASTRSGERRLMTPRVRCMAPIGLMAFGDSWDSSSTSGPVTSAAKRWREACHCGREDGVTRGRQRKWVSRGVGGIAEVLLSTET